MISPSDWRLLGLGIPGAARFGVPAPASLPMRESTELFPVWAADPRRTLRLGLGCSLHLGRAGELLAAFRRAYPDVELGLADVDYVRAADGLQREAMDAAILAPSKIPPGLRSAELWREPLIVATSADHPLAAVETIEPQALRHEIILLAGDARGDEALQGAIVHALGGPPVTFMRHQVERDTLLDLVALNFGIAIGPGLAANATHPGVCFRTLALPTAQTLYALLWKPSNRNPALHAFARVAQAFTHVDRPSAPRQR